jgi:hypothetical protein
MFGGKYSLHLQGWQYILEIFLPTYQITVPFHVPKDHSGSGLEAAACGLFESKTEETHGKYQSTPTEFNVKRQCEFSP